MNSLGSNHTGENFTTSRISEKDKSDVKVNPNYLKTFVPEFTYEYFDPSAGLNMPR